MVTSAQSPSSLTFLVFLRVVADKMQIFGTPKSQYKLSKIQSILKLCDGIEIVSLSSSLPRYTPMENQLHNTLPLVTLHILTYHDRPILNPVSLAGR